MISSTLVLYGIPTLVSLSPWNCLRDHILISDPCVQLAFAPYSDDWRHARRTFHQNFRSEATVKYHPLQTEKVHQFIRALSTSPGPEETVDHISA